MVLGIRNGLPLNCPLCTHSTRIHRLLSPFHTQQPNILNNPTILLVIQENDKFVPMKILIIMDILVLQFCEYMKYIRDISVNILIQNINKLKLIKIYRYKKKLLKMKLKV